MFDFKGFRAIEDFKLAVQHRVLQEEKSILKHCLEMRYGNGNERVFTYVVDAETTGVPNGTYSVPALREHIEYLIGGRATLVVSVDGPIVIMQVTKIDRHLWDVQRDHVDIDYDQQPEWADFDNLDEVVEKFRSGSLRPSWVTPVSWKWVAHDDHKHTLHIYIVDRYDSGSPIVDVTVSVGEHEEERVRSLITEIGNAAHTHWKRGLA